MYVSLSDLLNLTFDLKHTIYYVENLVTTKSVPCFSAGFTLLWDRQTDRQGCTRDKCHCWHPTNTQRSENSSSWQSTKEETLKTKTSRQTDRQTGERNSHTYRRETSYRWYYNEMYHEEPCGSHEPRHTQQKSNLQRLQTMWLHPPSFSMVARHFGHSWHKHIKWTHRSTQVATNC